MFGKEKGFQGSESCCGDKGSCDWDAFKRAIEEYCKDEKCSCDCKDMMKMCCAEE